MNNSFRTKSLLPFGKKKFSFFSLRTLEKDWSVPVSRFPFSIRVLLENLLRHEDGHLVTKKDIQTLCQWSPKKLAEKEIPFIPARVLLQDFTGVPVVVDLASMRDAAMSLGADPNRINPLFPVDLVIDHSVQVDAFGSKSAFKQNCVLEYKRNTERYSFLKWGQESLKNFRAIPPDTGIIHQINLEHLASVAGEGAGDSDNVVFPDTLIGTDSHTTTINGLGVLGWGVGGIEAEAAMLGQPLSMLMPEVVGVKLLGKLLPGATATDAALMLTQILRRKNVVGKFVEYFGPGASCLSLPDRAVIANMAPEYGATMGFFPVDEETIRFLALSGRSAEHVKLVESYCKNQGLFRAANSRNPDYSETIEFDLSGVEPCLAGPKRPQDRVALRNMRTSFYGSFSVPVPPRPAKTLMHGSVVLASITSCTNTSNPSLMLAAGLLAKKAVQKGLRVKPYVKTSLAPGSQVVTDYLNAAGLTKFLEKLKFHLVGYGCATCIGNSGPLPEPVSRAVEENQLVVCSVLSGNRNFEGRINPLVKANYLASPPLVIAYALAGKMDIDLSTEPLGFGKNRKPVFLKDVWPSRKEIHGALKKFVKKAMFEKRYAQAHKGDKNWNSLSVPQGHMFPWDESSTYIKNPPYFEGLSLVPEPVSDIKNARVLALFGDSVTTDHISPAGNIPLSGPAGQYLAAHGVKTEDFNSYGSRRGNHEVMVRGTFANIRIRNLLLPGTEGGMTLHLPSNAPMTIFEASQKYKSNKTPLIVLAGKEYGTGSSRDWAAKGPKLLGIQAVIAESFERIHRSNLAGMGILPLQFMPGESRETFQLTGKEVFDIIGIQDGLSPKKVLKVTARQNGSCICFDVITRLDTPVEADYFRNGGILQTVLRKLVANHASS